MDLTDFQRKAILLIFITTLVGSILLARKEPLITQNEKKEAAKKGKQTNTLPETPVKIDINTADSLLLVQLPGIGPMLANAIMAYRAEHGPFKTLQDLLNVPGIGEKRISRMKEMLDLPGGENTVLENGSNKLKSHAAKTQSHKEILNGKAESSAAETAASSPNIYDSRINEKAKCPYCGKQLWKKGGKKQAYIRCPHCMKLLC